jgi:hypothetical protein
MITLELQPKQAEAFTSPATELLYGGAAGGGKSHLVRVALIAWCQMIPGLQCALFRRTFADLHKNHMEGPTSFPQLLAPLVNAGHARIVQGEIIWSNGSRISLCHCQHEKDKLKYQGAEFHVLAIDELTHFTETIYRYLRGRVRMTGLDIPKHLKHLFPRIITSANPGGPGHSFVKRTWVKKGERPHRASKKEGGFIRQFISAKLSDNYALLRDDPEYATRLEGLGDAALVRALRDGDWDVVAGAMWGEVWRNARHTCDAFPIPHDWPIWVGADDGYSDAAAMLWLTENPRTKTLYAIAELYQTGLLPEAFVALATKINRSILRTDEQGDISANTEPIRGFMDSAAFADHGQTGPNGEKAVPRGNQLVALGLKLKPVPKWQGSRVHGVQEIHRLLAPNTKDPEKRPGLVFFKRCKMAIETVPTIGRDDKQPEDTEASENDHIIDAIRYGIQHKRGKPGSLKISA